MDANESFEKAAKAFRKASGYLAPGKNGCPRDHEGNLEPEVEHDWKIWCAAVDYMRTVTTIEVKAEKLDIKDDDIIVLTSPCGLDMENFDAFRGQFPKGKNNLFIILQTDEKISAMPEADMAEHGWYRREKTDG